MAVKLLYLKQSQELERLRKLIAEKRPQSMSYKILKHEIVELHRSLVIIDESVPRSKRFPDTGMYILAEYPKQTPFSEFIAAIKAVYQLKWK